MKNLTTTVAKLASISLDVVRINGFHTDYGWVSFNDSDFDEEELNREILVKDSFQYSEMSCGGCPMYGFRFEYDGIAFGNSFQTKDELDRFFLLLA